MTLSDARSRLILAGARLIAEGGLERVNSNQIARAAGVGVGTFYSQFKDKHALRSAIVLHAADVLRQRVERAVSAAGGEPAAQVRALVDAVVAFAEDNPALFRAAFSREGVSAGRAGVGISTRAAEARLRALQKQGRVHPAIDPAVGARAFACMQNGVVCWWLEDRTRAGRQQVIETLIRLHPASPLLR